MRMGLKEGTSWSRVRKVLFTVSLTASHHSEMCGMNTTLGTLRRASRNTCRTARGERHQGTCHTHTHTQIHTDQHPHTPRHTQTGFEKINDVLLECAPKRIGDGTTGLLFKN